VIAKKRRYAYRYFVHGTERPLHHCPICGRDLTEAGGGVIVVLYYGTGKSEAGLVETCSSLDRDGHLIDLEGEVAAGYHSTTLFRGCGVQLWQCADEEQIRS